MPFLVCQSNAGYEASLEVHRRYEVLPDPKAEAEGLVRIVDESNEDYLFPRALFDTPNDDAGGPNP